MTLQPNSEQARSSSEPAQEFRDRCYWEFNVPGPNAHQYWYRVKNPLIIIFNYLAIHAAKHMPSLAVKRWLFRRLGMKLGANVTIGSGVTLDYFFPELIEIGDNTIIGMDSMLLTHEFLHDRWRKGVVSIGKNVLVGANSTILAGVSIGDGVRISAASLVHKSVPTGTFVGGNPMQMLANRKGSPRSET